MRRFAKSPWIAICLVACGAGCLQKAADQAATGVQRIVTGRGVDRSIRIAIDRIESCRIDEGQPVRLDDLQTVMQERAEKIKHADAEPAQITIRISVDDAAPYSSLAQVVEACTESGFFKFELDVAKRAFPFDLTPPDPKTTTDDLELPPFNVRMQANEEGELAGLSLNDRQLVDVAQLRLEIIGIIGDDRGPGSIQEICEVEFDCDDNLKFAHLAAACQAVSGYEADDGGRVALVEKIWPVLPRPSREVQEVVEIEEFEMLEPLAEIGAETLEVESVELQPASSEAQQGDDESQPSFVFEDPRLDAPSESGAAAEDNSEAKPSSGDSPTDDGADGKQDGAAQIVPDPAVGAALQWLVNHQVADGSWKFDHRAARCRCDGAGTATTATNAATAMALLPLLAVGQTHQRGKHQLNVLRGVAYLVRKAKRQGNAASFHEPEGTMYSHGLATLALCEVYRQSGDAQLKPVCQAALDFIGDAQDPVGGGWRYAPRQPGDTSVTGWQVAALKSGQAAGLAVAANTLSGASRFLDSMQSDGGASYGYATPGFSPGTSAIGLQSRIHLGWKRDHEAWQRGVDKLVERGPSPGNMYFNFYATQALAQRGGEPWTAWQASIQNILVDSQSSDGHATGSWHLGGDHSSARGGRLYNTSLAALILATRHRNLAIFQIDDSEQRTPEDSN